MALDLSNLPDKAIDFSKLPDKGIDFSNLPDKQDTSLWDRFVKATGAESDMMSQPAGLEVPLALGTGMVASVVAPVAQVLTRISGQGYGGSAEFAKKVKEGTQDVFTYQPKNEYSKAILETISPYINIPAILGNLLESDSTVSENFSKGIPYGGSKVVNEIAGELQRKWGTPLRDSLKMFGLEGTTQDIAKTLLEFYGYGKTAKTIHAGKVKASEIAIKVGDKTRIPNIEPFEAKEHYTRTPDTTAELKQAQPKEIITTEELNAQETIVPVEKSEPTAEPPKEVAPEIKAEAQKVEPAVEGDIPIKAQEGVKAEIHKAETPIEGKPAKSAVDVNNEATGIKNESVDASRQRRNIEELERHGVTNADQEVSFNRAKQLVDSGERNPRELADKITQNKDYQVSELDSFVLQYERAKLENAHKNIYKQIEEAQKKGDTEAELKLIEEREKIETDLDLNDRASGVAGTQWSNIGKARQRMIAEDYSLSAIIRKARADKGGEALTPEERIKYENFAKEIAEANEKIKTLEEANAKLESEKTVKQIQNKIRYETRQAKRTYTKEQLKTESDTLVKELNDVLGGLHANPFADPKAVKILGRLAENKVRSGYLTVEGVIDSIYTDLKNAGIEVTKRDIRDAISGYGKTTYLSKEEITAKLRELRHEMRLVSALEDAQNKQVPLKSGLQRDLPTDQIRELQRKVKQEMREQGIDNVKTPEERWKSSLDAVKTRLKHQITDLAKRLETGEIEPKKIGIKYDEQAMDLVRVRNKVQDVLNFAEGVKGKELSPEQKIRNAKASVERSIGEYERRLRENDLSPKKKVSTTPNTKELQKLRNERDLLKDLYKTLQEEAKPKLSPEEIALKSYKTRTANRITELEQKIKNNDFAPKKKNETKLDGEALKLYHELDRVKYRYQEARMKDLWKRKNVLEKGYEGVKETANLMRSLKASMDVSAVFRQGLFFSVSHPVLSAKSVPAMLKAFANDKYRFQTEQQIINNPKYKLAKDSGLELTDIGNNLSHMEETFMSRLANKIPGVAGSQRAYTTFLNKTRMDVFDSLTSKLSKEEGKILPEESKAIATLVNEATGRGSLGKANQWTGLNSLFFAPRLVASRFQLLAGHSLWKGTGASRKLIAKEYGRFLGGVATLYALSEMAGFNIEYDPRSSDFGKIKIGNTRIDPLAGLSQALVFASRIGTQETKDAQTEIVSSLREPPTPLSPDITDTIKNFGRSKLAPMPGTIVNYLAGRNVVGEKIGIKEIPRETVIPIPWVDTYEAMVEQGIPSGLALGTLAMLGVGIQTYDKNATWENKPTQASEALRKRVGEKRFKEIQSIYSEMLNKKIENIVATNRYQNLSNEEKRKKIEEIRRTTKERYLGK